MIPTLMYKRGRAADTLNADAASVYTNLVSWWSLDENAADPTYNDSHGSNHLTQRNAGGSVNTSVNSGASFIQGTRYWNANNTDNLTCYIPRSNTALDMTTHADRSFGGWFRTAPGAASTTGFLMGRMGSVFDQLYLWLWLDGTDNLIKARYSADGSTAAQTVSSGVASDSTDAHLVVCTYNTAGTLEIRVRKVGGSLAKTTAALGSNIYSASTDTNFTIGEGLENDASFNGSNRNCVKNADECFFLSKAITDNEFNYLYNNGNGKTYTQLVADAT
jgi:hypothetical protein